MTKTVTKNKVRSVEPLIADLANGWMKSYNLDYKLEQEPLNTEIDKALDEYLSKSGGKGGNRPDAKLLLQDKNLNYWPVLIEYKGYKGKLEKLDSCGNIDNLTARNEPNYSNIKSFAVNGAVHYANALLHHTSYTDIIAIGMTGYKDELGKLKHSISCSFRSLNCSSCSALIFKVLTFSINLSNSGGGKNDRSVYSPTFCPTPKLFLET